MFKTVVRLVKDEPPRHGCSGCMKQETDTLFVSLLSLITRTLSQGEGEGRLLQRENQERFVPVEGSNDIFKGFTKYQDI